MLLDMISDWDDDRRLHTADQHVSTQQHHNIRYILPHTHRDLRHFCRQYDRNDVSNSQTSNVLAIMERYLGFPLTKIVTQAKIQFVSNEICPLYDRPYIKLSFLYKVNIKVSQRDFC